MTNEPKKPNQNKETNPKAEEQSENLAENLEGNLEGNLSPEETTHMAESAAQKLAASILGGSKEVEDNKLQEAEEKALRAMAELENTRRRLEREIAEAGKFGAARFAGDLLVVADNLERALDSFDNSSETSKALKVGVELTRSELLRVFQQHGVSPIKVGKGDNFDYQRHQAMGETQDESVAAGKITQVLQKGYLMHDRLLRPSMVMVAAQKGAGGSKGPDANADASAKPKAKAAQNRKTKAAGAAGDSSANSPERVDKTV